MRGDKNTIKKLITLVILLLILGTFFFKEIEGFSTVDAFYFSVATISTVGYGDLAPTSDFGKIFTSIYILFGVAIVIQTINIIAQKTISRHHKKLKEKIKTELEVKEEIKEEIQEIAEIKKKTPKKKNTSKKKAIKK